MKKWMLAVLTLLVVLLACAHFFIPDTIAISRSVSVQHNSASIIRSLQQEKNWQQWWLRGAGDEQAAQPVSVQALFNGAAIQNINAKDTGTHVITVIPVSPRSNMIKWDGAIRSGGSLFQRIGAWFAARKMGRQVESALERIQDFVLDTEQVYGMKISRQRVTDTLLMVTRFTTNSYPGTEDIYQHTGLLQQYLAGKDVKATNFPMLHTSQTAGGQYQSMVAIPTSRLLPDSAGIVQKRMVDGYILVAEVRGGQGAVEQALRQMDVYIADEGLKSPAIPFASLVTNRIEERDSSKWITKVYYPIY